MASARQNLCCDWTNSINLGFIWIMTFLIVLSPLNMLVKYMDRTDKKNQEMFIGVINLK